MDDRRRLLEPVTDGGRARAFGRAAAGAAPAARRMRARFGLVRVLQRLLDLIVSLPLPRGLGVACAAAFLLLSAGFGVVRGGHAPLVMAELDELCDNAANAVGFRITSISLLGQRHLSQKDILTAAGITDRTSLLFLDVAGTRARLMANPWIAEATVLKLYPGRLHIAVTERDAFALWQVNGKVSVISDDGTVVDPTVSARFADLPLVVGVGAGARAKDFLALLDRYPLIRRQTRAAVLVAERRWNLVLDNGIDVRLPEHDVDQALRTLVQFDHDKKLLARDITAIDLRLADRLTVRLSDDASAARLEALGKDKKPKKKAGAA